MTDPQVAIFMLSLFIFLVLLGFPIAFTLIAMGVGFGYYAYYQADNLLNNQIFYLLNQNAYSVMENDVLVAIPLFLFMGYVVERANIVNRLFPVKAQAWIDLTLYILFFFPGMLALFYFGYEIASDSWRYKEVSWNSPARIQIYYFKSLIPLAGGLLILQGVSECMRCILCIKNGEWMNRHDDVRETEEDLIRKTREEEREKEVLKN